MASLTRSIAIDAPAKQVFDWEDPSNEPGVCPSMPRMAVDPTPDGKGTMR